MADSKQKYEIRAAKYPTLFIARKYNILYNGDIRRKAGCFLGSPAFRVPFVSGYHMVSASKAAAWHRAGEVLFFRRKVIRSVRKVRGQMSDKKRNRIMGFIFSFLLIGVVLYLVLGECLLPADEWGNSGRAQSYQEQWVRVLDNGEKVIQEVPGRCQAERNEAVILETVLPETIQKDTYLCFRSGKQDMELSVDGVLRQKYSTGQTRIFGKVSAVAYVFLEIHPEDAGKTLRVKTQTDSSYSGIFYTVYIGSQIEIWKNYFINYGAELGVAFLIIVLSAISIIGSTALRIYYKRRVNLEYLGFGSLIAGIWLIANSVLRQLMFPNLSVINDIAFYTLMLLPLPYLFYMNVVQKRRYEKGYFIIEVAAVLDFLCCTILHLFHWVDFTDTIVFMAGICGLTILYMAVTILIDIRKGFVREYRYVAAGMCFSIIFAMLQIVIYFQRTSLFNGVVLAVGLMFLLIFATINTIGEIISMIKEKQQALSASEAKGRFLANMSHEIRTPINAVLGMDTMILRESTEPEIRKYALDIRTAGQSLLALINDILDLSRIESGKVEIISAEYDFSSLIHDTVNMVREKAENKKLAVCLQMDEKLPSRLVGDEVRIRQVLINLLNNAVKYTEQGSITLKIDGAVEGAEIVLTFSVEDTGIGIREEDIEKLFAEFERIEEQKNRHIEGTGLGMSITTQLLALMGSRLSVESEYGRGSRFSFVLRQGIADREPIGDLERRIQEQAEQFSYHTTFLAPDANILVVDDNAINRRVFVSLLKATKIKIDEAADGFECLEKVRKKEYDMIFLDHMMPELDGIETLHQMKALGDYPCKETPVVALTANAVSGAREMYLKEGFAQFLSKPIDTEKLEKLLMETLPEEKVILQEEKESVKVQVPEEMPVITGIDWEYALLHCGGMGVLVETMADFCRLADTEYKDLKQYFESIGQTLQEEQLVQKLEQYRIRVHSMKSSAAMVGAVSLAGVARLLEQAAREQKKERILQLTPVFLEEWQEMKERLVPVVKEWMPEKKGEKPEADLKMLKEYLKLLQEAMEDMDVDTADEIAEQLKRFCYPGQLEDEIESLTRAVAGLDAERVSVISGKIKEGLS